MNTENLFIEAWLKAGLGASAEPLCPEDSTLDDLVGKRLGADEARLVTMHLACCASCRKYVARQVAFFAVPSTKPVTLRGLLSKGAVTQAWRDWVRDLVSFLPPEEEEMNSFANAEYEVASPLRIDDLGRLIVELAFLHPQPAGTKATLALENQGTRLELCDVTVRRDSLYAVVDLSAFEPRPGILREGVFALEMVPIAAKQKGLLPFLAGLQKENLQGAEFWDRFAPEAAAYGGRMAEALAQEIPMLEADRTTRAPSLRAKGAEAFSEETLANIKVGKEPATGRFKPQAQEESSVLPSTTAADRVQYALRTLEEYAVTWRECNSEELPGIQDYISQLRSALSGEPEGQTVAPGLRKSVVEPSEQSVPARSRRGDAEKPGSLP